MAVYGGWQNTVAAVEEIDEEEDDGDKESELHRRSNLGMRQQSAP